MPLSDYIVTDDLTIVLGVIGISVYLLQNFYKPQPLVHPILLGRQSDVGRVRHPTESPVYRNYGTGLMGRFPIKPDKDVNVVNDMVRPQFEARRTLWSTKITNAQLNERVNALGAGISRILREDSNVLLLLNDGIEFLIADLALAKRSIVSMTLCSPKLLSRVLETHPPTAIITDADFIPLLLELIYDAREYDHKIIVVGKYEGNHHPKTAKQVEIIPWAQIETDGANITESVAAGTQRPNDPYTLAFFEAPSGKMQAVRFTHENMTSGVAAIRALFPPSMALSGVDTIVSNHSLSTPYGRAIAYSALYENASFATIDSTRIYDTTRVGDTNGVQLRNAQPHNLADVLSARRHPIPYPTVLFIGPDHLEDLSSSILKHARELWLYSFAWRHKLAAFAEGFLSKDSLWDRMVFDNAREHVLGGMASALKVVIISGGPISSEALTPARIALSIPMINMHVNPWVSGPLFATQAFDAQVLPSGQEPAHVGGPSVNVEAKLKGVKDTYLEENEDPVGEIVVRGPTVGASVGEGAENVAWQEISEIGRAMTNGAFKVVGVRTA
ncbi:hypothetical protein EDD16DRAFT_45119 [Pisolithus croceorrhizus]|nr:hypothetical protein EDD16DRAFT_45119 [Pisolithus croceorrhizus]